MQINLKKSALFGGKNPKKNGLYIFKYCTNNFADYVFVTLEDGWVFDYPNASSSVPIEKDHFESWARVKFQNSHL